jgi:hypothetical protein
MSTARARLIGLALAGCTALAGSGCASDAPPTALGPGIVTPGGASAGSASSPPPVDSSATPTQSASPAPVRDDAAEIEVENQSGDGRTVRIQQAQLSRAGFVVVYAKDGKRLLGSAKIKPSTDNRPITVRLDRRLTASAQLLVVLHADDGDGRFNVKQDPRVPGAEDGGRFNVQQNRPVAGGQDPPVAGGDDDDDNGGDDDNGDDDDGGDDDGGDDD